MNNTEEKWQAEVNGQVYDAAFSELAAWVGENALLPNDKVRRGNLRWLEAGKIPALMPFFNAKEMGIAPPEIPVSAVDGENADADVQINTANFAPGFDETQNYSQTTEVCVLHTGAEAKFVCETCFNNFCEACPPTAESLGKLCPMCGALVKDIANQTQVFQPQDFPVQSEEFPHSGNDFQYHPQQSYLQTTGSFGFGDFGRALAHPFKYKTSLIFGALMYMFFTLGQQAYALGGIFMIFAAVVAFMLANMLTFGILANVVENFANRKTDTNFMPSFEDFSLWDDVIHPFFLSIGAYLVSFGLFFVIAIGGVWYMVGSLQSEMLSVGQNSASALIPGMNGDMQNLQNAPQLQKSVGDVKQQVESAQNGAPNPAYNEEQQFQEMQKMIDDTRRNQLESVTGVSPEAKQAQMNEMGRKFLKKALPLVILAGLAFLWGIFYFPAACAVAGYTRSFSATMNPKIGWDTIKNLGSDYALILLMMFIIGGASLAIAIVLRGLFLVFDMPMVGNIPAIIVMSWVTFYFWIVISCILGYAIDKKSDKLGIYRGE